MSRFLFIGLFIMLAAFPLALMAQADFRFLPYLQNPAPNAITIVWFSNANSPGLLTYAKSNEPEKTCTSTPVLAGALAYSTWESNTFFGGQSPAPPYCHQIRLTGLETGTIYNYSDGYNQPGSERAINKFHAYFDFPAKGSPDPDQERRYQKFPVHNDVPEIWDGNRLVDGG